MCKFFSFVTQGDGKMFYFADDIRKKILKKELNYGTDSHSSIIDYYFGQQSITAEFHKGDLEERFNKYEYNPLTKSFIIDSLSSNVPDDSKIVSKKCEMLDFSTIVPELIVKPIVNPLLIERSEIVSAQEIKLLKNWASIRTSVGDYTYSFFDLEQLGIKKDDITSIKSCTALWESGLIPSYDGKLWRLHAGEKSNIVWEGEI